MDSFFLKIICEVAQATSFLHSFSPSPIVHRDIKTENILLAADTSVRLADLGEARFNDETKTMTMVGTRGFVAPEIIRCERYDAKADIFSFAM